MRPKGQSDVLEERLRFRERIAPPGDSQTEADVAIVQADQEVSQQQPTAGEPPIQTVVPMPGLAETAADETAIIQQHHHGGRDHHFLARHPQEARGYGQGEPREGPLGFGAANESVQRQQIKQPHQRFAALGNVRDRLGLQGMN